MLFEFVELQKMITKKMCRSLKNDYRLRSRRLSVWEIFKSVSILQIRAAEEEICWCCHIFQIPLPHLVTQAFCYEFEVSKLKLREPQ